MSSNLSRRNVLGKLGASLAGLLTLPAQKTAKAAVQSVAQTGAPKGYDPTKHTWRMAVDVNKCIGCGLCAEACKTENHVPMKGAYFRTWIERSGGVKAIAATLKDLDEFPTPEDRPDFYVDYDETGPYEVALGDSECAV